MDKAKQYEFETITKPVIKWLNDNGHPHMKAIVDQTSAELVEGLCSVYTEEFIND